MNIENKNNNVGPPEQKSDADPGPDSSVFKNPEPRTANPEPHSANPEPRTENPEPIPCAGRPKRAGFKHRNHRRTGKVARLPATIRHEIALRFMRYEEYKDIISWLASQGHPGISDSN